MTEPSNTPIANRIFFTLGSVLMILMVLYFGKPVLLPIALSVLLAFILNPLVKSLERLRLGRIVSVLIASSLSFAIIGLAMWSLASQVQKLAIDLPNHQHEIQNKIDSFKTSDDSTVGKLSSMFRELLNPEAGPSLPSDESDNNNASGINNKTDPVSESSQPNKISLAGPEGVYVVRQPEGAPGSFATATAILLPILEPLAMTALVVVLVIFLLIRREDVRYRMITLMGDSALTGTTRLMRDAAERVSKYLLNLLMVNAAFGIWFGVGLYLLDVPYAPLWGFLTLCFRFIPFIGSPASLLLPLAISVATSTGWSQPIIVLIFFSISELVTANIIEPVLFGKTTGLTPIALLVAVLFWTWVWGPIGLLLSTPLTVCLVVLGQHIPQLRSLKVLLAEQPALDARLQYFQRLLAGDAHEAKRVLTSHYEEFGIEKTFDRVIVPALHWARRERERESIKPDEEDFIWRSTEEAIASLVKSTAVDEELANGDAAVTVAPPLQVYAHPVHHESEQIALTMLQNLIGKSCDFFTSNTRKLPTRAVSEITTSQPDVVVLSIVPPGGIPQVKFLCREIRDANPDLCIIVAYFDKVKKYDELLVSLRKDGASYLTTSLSQTMKQIEMVAETKRAEQPPATEPITAPQLG